jgi:hypothetical protein
MCLFKRMYADGIVMERDYRITGKFRGQSDVVEAPVGFEGRQIYLFMFTER